MAETVAATAKLPVGRLERGWRWCRRNPAIAGLTGATFAILLTVTAISLVLAGKANAAALRDAAAVSSRGMGVFDHYEQHSFRDREGNLQTRTEFVPRSLIAGVGPSFRGFRLRPGTSGGVGFNPNMIGD